MPLASASEPVDKSIIFRGIYIRFKISRLIPAELCRISAERGINEPMMIDNFRPEMATDIKVIIKLETNSSNAALRFSRVYTEQLFKLLEYPRVEFARKHSRLSCARREFAVERIPSS